MRVTLSHEDMRRVHEVVQRNRRLYRGKPNGHGAAPDAISFDDEIGGMAGELAAAKFFRARWNAEFTTATDVSDIGEYTQVRTLTRSSSQRLLIRPYDIRKYGNVPYVLVRREGDREFVILGWIMAHEVPARGRLSDGGNSKRPPVYFVNPEDLEAVHELKVI